MAKKKVDGVVEAVRYKPDGKIDIVRIYERRGETYSDRLLLSRQELIERLRSKKRYFVGRRRPYLGSTFDIEAPVTLYGSDGQELLLAGAAGGDRDLLQGAPLF